VKQLIDIRRTEPLSPIQGDRPMSRRDYARTRTLAARIRPVLNAIAVVATCAAAAWAGAMV
jgi:hypothetical protein